MSGSGKGAIVLAHRNEDHGGARVKRRPEPNFFIVGSPRAGTTTLWYMLRQHRDVFMPRHKEPYHYCESHPPFAIKDWEQYLALFAPARKETAIGEASAWYLTSPTAPQRLAANHPDAKIVIMLRDPVERAHSMYRLNCSLGFEWLSSFEKALAAEAGRQADERFRTANPYFFEAYLYFASGLVADGVKRYMSAFPPERIRIIFFEDFKKDALRVTRETVAFLGVDPDFAPDEEPQNVSLVPLWVRGHHAITRRLGVFSASDVRVPLSRRRRWLGFAWNLNLMLGGALRSPDVLPGTRRRLIDRYAEDIQETSRLTGRNLDAWLR